MLRDLNRNEAVAFINLVSEFARVDQNFNDEEKELIERFLDKLDISKDEVKEMDINSAKGVLKSASDKVKKIAYFELLGVALIDGEYENTEIDFLDNLAEEFDISRADKIAYANYYFDFENLESLSEEERKSRAEAIIK